MANPGLVFFFAALEHSFGIKICPLFWDLPLVTVETQISVRSRFKTFWIFHVPNAVKVDIFFTINGGWYMKMSKPLAAVSAV